MAEQSAELISFTPASSLQLGDGGGGGVGEGLGLEPPRPRLRISYSQIWKLWMSRYLNHIISRRKQEDKYMRKKGGGNVIQKTADSHWFRFSNEKKMRVQVQRGRGQALHGVVHVNANPLKTNTKR